jgi:UDP-N-acetylmuramate dehydrogenase
MRKNVKLSPFTTFRIGGPADFFLQADSVKKLLLGLEFARSHGLPVFVLGGGSNLLVSDLGFRGLVIKNALRGIRQKGASITVRSGESLSRLLCFAADRSLGGLEFAAGIPGTVGGALYGNAGAYGQAVGDFLARAEIISMDGTRRVVDRDYFKFRYRHSRLKETGEILTWAAFSLHPGSRCESLARMEGILAERAKKHPSREWGCAGSFFKNLDPPNPGENRMPAGRLLDQVGARGVKVGSAVVFPGHANFLANPGGATAAEVLELAGKLKEKVKERFGIELEEEVLYVGEFVSGRHKVNLPCGHPP